MGEAWPPEASTKQQRAARSLAAEKKAAAEKASVANGVDDLLGDLNSGKPQYEQPSRGTDISEYVARFKAALQARMPAKDEYQGKVRTLKMEFNLSAELLSVASEGGDPALCEAALKASKSAHYPAFPNAATYQVFKSFIIDFKP